MGELNCQQCQYRHEDNGNCTAIGGFCTAVPAAHCRLLREYLSTGSTPKEVTGIFQKACAQAREIEDGLNADDYSIDRMVELMKADKAGRVLILPCKVGDTVYFVNAQHILEFTVVGYAVIETGVSWVYSEHVFRSGHTSERTFSPDRIGKIVFLSREEAEKALEARKDG